MRVEEGAVASLVFALPRVAASLGGWISVRAPFNVDVLENAEVIGTGDIAKMMLPAGRHDIVLVNRALDYREARRIDVAAGSTTAVRVDPPVATVSANARPWADVTIDGKASARRRSRICRYRSAYTSSSFVIRGLESAVRRSRSP